MSGMRPMAYDRRHVTSSAWSSYGAEYWWKPAMMAAEEKGGGGLAE